MIVSKEIMRSTLRTFCRDNDVDGLMNRIRILGNNSHYPKSIKWSFHPYNNNLFVYIKWNDNNSESNPYTRYTEDEFVDMLVKAEELREATEHIHEVTNEVNDDLKNRFTYHEPKDGQPDIYVKIREKALELGVLIDQLVPDCPEKAHAIDKVDEAVMWANAGVNRHG